MTMLETNLFLHFANQILKEFFPCDHHIFTACVFLTFFLASLQSRYVTIMLLATRVSRAFSSDLLLYQLGLLLVVSIVIKLTRL